MSKKLIYDNIIVIKTEVTSWDGIKPDEEESEVIEIGLCLFNVKSTRVHSKSQYFIKPTTSSVSEYCTRQTGLTNEFLNKHGQSFEEVCSSLKDKLNSNKRVWAGFGDTDRRNIEKQCLNFDVPFPFTSRFLNIKMLAPIIYGLNRELSAHEAMAAAGITPENEREAGMEEAWNAALILREVILGGPPRF